MWADEAKRLFQLLKESSLKYGDFTLSSGAKSSYYYDGKMTTLSPEGAYLAGRVIFHLLEEAKIDAVGGLTIGADPIVTAVALVSHLEGHPIPGFIIRREPKKHGTKKDIEGPLPSKADCKVAIVDDVVTTGKSLLEAIRKAEASGCKVAKVVALVDRKEGGSARLRQMGYDFVAFATLDESGELTIDKSSTAASRTQGEVREGILPR